LAVATRARKDKDEGDDTLERKPKRKEDWIIWPEQRKASCSFIIAKNYKN
jgi:hypothetical protein